MTNKIPEIEPEPIPPIGYLLAKELQKKKYYPNEGIHRYHPIEDRLQLPQISNLELRVAPNRLARNILVGQLLENPVELILSRIGGVDYFRGPRYQIGARPTAIPDFHFGFKDSMFCIECKNWPSRLEIDERGIDNHILSRFRRFEKVFHHGPEAYTRIAVLAGVRYHCLAMSHLHSHGVIVVSLPAIRPRGPTVRKLRFLDWALRAIVNGSKESPYILTR